MWVSTVLVAVIATICIVAYVEFEESHLRNIDRTLSAMANGILASLDGNRDGEALTKEIHAVTGTDRQNSSILYRLWVDGASADLSASDPPTSKRGRWLRELPVQNSPLRGQVTFFSTGRRGDEYRAVWARQEVDAGVVNIVVADSSHYTYHEMDEFLRLMLVLGGSLIVGSAVLVTFGVRWALGPIDAAAEQLHKIRQPNVPKLSFDNEKAPEELRPFIRALTEMLHRLDSVFERQKRFTADAAHELRTPLAVVKSTLQATQMHERDANEYRRAIADALKDVARMEHLIEQLLILARMDENSEHIAAAEVQLDVLLRELAEAYDQRIGRSGGKVILEEPPVTTVQGDLDELARLFSNVFDNAVRYGPSDGTISIALKCKPDSCATVCIHDEGGNIPPEALPHLFDRFYRVDHSRSSSTGGVGLGLAIAREIARRHNGDISIASEPNSGTLVCIRLPCSPPLAGSKKVNHS